MTNPLAGYDTTGIDLKNPIRPPGVGNNNGIEHGNTGVVGPMDGSGQNDANRGVHAPYSPTPVTPGVYGNTQGGPPMPQDHGEDRIRDPRGPSWMQPVTSDQVNQLMARYPQMQGLMSQLPQGMDAATFINQYRDALLSWMQNRPHMHDYQHGGGVPGQTFQQSRDDWRSQHPTPQSYLDSILHPPVAATPPIIDPSQVPHPTGVMPTNPAATSNLTTSLLYG